MTTATAPRRTPGPPWRALRVEIVVTVVLTAIGASVAGVLRGAPQTWGVLVGTALVVGFFTAGAFADGLAATLAPATSLVVALMTYLLQVLVLAAVFVLLVGTGIVPDRIDPLWLGGTILVGTLLWTAALVRTALTERRPVYDEPFSGPGGGSGSASSTLGTTP